MTEKTQLFQFAGERPAEKTEAEKKKKWYQAVSCFVTFQLVMFGFYIFSGRMIETVAGFIK